ncbi:PREDICTED: von Willebrand factor A domain-containing protein 1 [Dipodomys ordii]|uniref:von Willebrand factor A domain-containing protein 1 n=1 Tax=Dipodomys ordii TaxID=10020 RepID=A0A1S3GFS7_DIPOR|nr:PREDICTED: von Willebrand factor A domain-containing protein 1 [Dipodomys ordii]
MSERRLPDHSVCASSGVCIKSCLALTTTPLAGLHVPGDLLSAHVRALEVWEAVQSRRTSWSEGYKQRAREGLGLPPSPAAGSEALSFSPGPPAAAPQGDLLFLLDSSASVSHYEFSRVREFVGQLVAPLPVGPGALRASLVHVSSRPHTEFPFNQHGSGQAVQDAVRAAAQRMGDTNTGLALAYVKEQLFAEAAGARPGVPKVLVWVTDGGSSDPVGPPMQELKDLGVTVFIVSTGRGNLLELSAAASTPAEKHLRFVDVDDLSIITAELQASILGAVQPQRLHAAEVTPHGFRLAWPPLLTADSGFYVLELAPSAEPEAARRQRVPGDATGWSWSGLRPDTDYDVVLLPESNLRLLGPQHVRVRTLPAPSPAFPWGGTFERLHPLRKPAGQQTQTWDGPEGTLGPWAVRANRGAGRGLGAFRGLELEAQPAPSASLPAPGGGLLAVPPPAAALSSFRRFRAASAGRRRRRRGGSSEASVVTTEAPGLAHAPCINVVPYRTP